MKHFQILFLNTPTSQQKHDILALLPQNSTVSVSFLTIFTDDLPEILPELVHEIEKIGVRLKKTVKTFKILNFSCTSCATSAETTLKYVDGVISSQANYATNSARVEYLENIANPEIFKRNLAELGFELVIDNPDNSEKSSSKVQKRRLIFAGVLAIPLFVLGMAFMHNKLVAYIMWALCTPLIFIFGRHFFTNAWALLKRKTTNMDTLVALSTGVAYIFSVYNLLNNNYHQIYFESAGLVIFFVLLGKYIENNAKNNASMAIKSLIDLTSKEVNVLKADKVILQPIEICKVGEVIRVLPGEKIPLDGIVIKGNSYVDEHLINGEPMPKVKNLGDYVFAGTINQDGLLEISVNKTAENTFLAKIIEKVENALATKAPIQKYVDKVAAVFVPIIILISISAFIIWYFGFNNPEMAFLSFITVLVIACPCAMGLATPTALLVGIGKGAIAGILIKNADKLEQAAKITDLVLDKTGTITEGKPKVVLAKWFTDNDSLKSILFSIESNSTHPLAKAVVEFYKGTNAIKLDHLVNIPGKGIFANIDDIEYFVGNEKLMHENNISVQNLEISHRDSIVFFANKTNLLAYFNISDSLIENINDDLATLKPIVLHLLSGDNAEVVDKVAKQLNISNQQGEVLPNQKAEYIKNLQANGKVVGMVGDGINDTLAFTQSDLSIAMSDGSDIAIEIADITILGNDLSRLSKAINLSKNTSKTIKQNLFWAFFYNALGVPVAAGVLYFYNGFIMNPMFASAAMAFSSVSVVLNSLLLKYKKI